VLDVKDELVSV